MNETVTLEVFGARRALLLAEAEREIVDLLRTRAEDDPTAAGLPPATDYRVISVTYEPDASVCTHESAERRVAQWKATIVASVVTP